MSKQKLFFYPMSLNHYNALFEHLDLSPIKELIPTTGKNLSPIKQSVALLSMPTYKALELYLK